MQQGICEIQVYIRVANSEAIATSLPEKASELAFFDASFARRQAKVFEGATTKVANMFAVLFQNLASWCILTVLVVVLVLLNAMLRMSCRRSWQELSPAV